MFRHPQTVEGEKRLASRRACRELGDRRKRIQQRARQSQSWTRPSGESRDVAQQVDESNVIASKYVPLTDFAAGQRRNMTCRYVVDVDQIESRFDVSAHASRRRLDNHPARWSRSNITRADRRRRVHDDRRQSVVRDHRLDHSLGRDLASFVCSDRRRFFKRNGFVRCFAVP